MATDPAALNAPAPPNPPGPPGSRRSGTAGFGGGTGANTEHKLVVMALDRKTGKVVWQHSPKTVSPDGSQLAINVMDTSGNTQIYLRPLNAEQAQKLEGTDGAIYPFWAPDSRSIGFFAGGKLKRIEASGGPAQILCNAQAGRSGSWNRDGVIIFASYRRDQTIAHDLYRVSATGGEPSLLTRLEQSR